MSVRWNCPECGHDRFKMVGSAGDRVCLNKKCESIFSFIPGHWLRRGFLDPEPDYEEFAGFPKAED